VWSVQKGGYSRPKGERVRCKRVHEIVGDPCHIGSLEGRGYAWARGVDIPRAHEGHDGKGSSVVLGVV